LLLTSSRHQQRSFSTQASGGNKMATAQTIQQRSSLDLALANPVYQGVCGLRLVLLQHSAGVLGPGWCSILQSIPLVTLKDIPQQPGMWSGAG
jgi:hypothetical protein